MPGLATQLPTDSIGPAVWIYILFSAPLPHMCSSSSGLCGQSLSVLDQGSWVLQLAGLGLTALVCPAQLPTSSRLLLHLLSAGEHIPHPARLHQCSFCPRVVQTVSIRHRQLPDALLQNGIDVHQCSIGRGTTQEACFSAPGLGSEPKWASSSAS